MFAVTYPLYEMRLQSHLKTMSYCNLHDILLNVGILLIFTNKGI